MIKIKVDFGKKIILAVAIVLACSMFLTGCSNKVSFKFRGGHVDIQEYPEYLQSEVLLNSLEDLNAFRNSAGWLGDETVDAQKSDARLNEVLDGYDRQYFSNNSLVIIVKKWSTNIEPIKRVEVKKLTKEKNSLVIDLDVLFNDANLLLPEGENKHFVCILGIERDELGEIDALTVRYNKKTVEYTPFEDEIFIY